MIVYRHRRLDTNEIFYVGIGRTENRAYDKHKRNPHWHNTVNKCGYSVEIVAELDTWELACELEQFLIQEYGRRDLGTGPLVNMTDGGDGAAKYKHTIKHIEKITGEGNPFYGKKHCDSTKRLLAKKNGFKVLNLKTGEIYDTIKDASRDLGIDYSWTKKQLAKGEYKNLIYYNNGSE